MEVIKLLAQVGSPPLGQLTLYDALSTRFRTLQLAKNPDCPLCGENPSITQPVHYEQTCCTMSDSITVQELRSLLNSDWKGRLIDVRQPDEHAEANIPGAELFPLPDLPTSVASWDKDADYILHCKSGMRSAKAQKIMQEKGFKNVRNTKGGIDAWLENEGL